MPPLPTTGIGQTGLKATLSIGNISGSGGAETFNVIGQLTPFSVSGGKREIIDTTTLLDAIKQKLGGVADAGTATLAFNRLPLGADPGQAAVEAASASPFPFDFKLVLAPFASAGQTTAGDTWNFSAIVTSQPSWKVDSNSVIAYSFDIDICGLPTWVPGS